ncbi:MAG: Sll0314/Alr1548 family TPR repeat-containing protein [Limnothrix sp.]
MTKKASFSFKNILTKTTLNLSLAALSVSSTLLPAFAGDPFRTSEPRAISSQTELAFNAIFKEGDYPVAKQYLEQAYQGDTSDPLVPALMASLAYTNQNWDQLNEYAQEVKRRAAGLMDSDKLRGNLYLGVGHFMEGGYLFETKGTIAALGKVPTAISYFDKAKQEDANDPEYNLIRGYADLLLATNLPFANVQQAIDRFEQHGAPEYLVQRGIAIAHRDLKNMPQALSYVNLALSGTNNNPELHYLKAQILYMRGNRQDNVSEKTASYAEARTHFDIAYERRSQLPAVTAKQLESEYKKFSRSFEQYNQ